MNAADSMPADTVPPVSFWAISIALLLWGLGGASIYVAYFLETPDQFAQAAESAANSEAYADYIANIPFWAIVIGMTAAVTRLLGAIGLLLRRAWALPLFLISVGLFLIVLYRAFVLANVASAMSGTHIAVELVFVALGLFAVWFARDNRSKNILK
jgi:nitrate reductase gamma subunit